MKKSESKPAVKMIGGNCVHLKFKEAKRVSRNATYYNYLKYYCYITCLKCGPRTTCNQFDDKGKLRFQAKESITNEK